MSVFTLESANQPPMRKTMNFTSKPQSVLTLLSLVLLGMVAGCAMDNPIDYSIERSSANTPDNGNSSGSEYGSGVLAPLSWISETDNSSYELGRRIEVDTSNNIYVLGTTHSAQEHFPINDYFVRMYDTMGIEQWTQQLDFGNSWDRRGVDITVDKSKNVYVTGFGGSDLFVVKYDIAGAKQWTQQLDVLYSGGDIAVGNSDIVYVIGNGSKGPFLVKYDSAGVKQWTQQLDGFVCDGRGIEMTIDDNDNIYVTCGTSNALFVGKYDSTGVKQWTQQLDGFPYHIGGIANDSIGNVYVTGTMISTFDGYTTDGSGDVFLVKYSSSGVKQWTQQLGSSEYDSSHGITVDSTGNIYMTGWTLGSLDGKSSNNQSDLFVVQYNSAGVRQWTQQLDDTWDNSGYGIAVDHNDNIFVTGYTAKDINGPTGEGGPSLLVIKYE